MANDVFICYETLTGKSYAKNLHDALRKDGSNPFLASSDILTKDLWRIRINSALEKSPIFIIVFTSGVNYSDEVKRELEKASELEKDFIVCRWHGILVSETEIEISQGKKLSDYHQIEFEDKYDLANKVLSEIKRLREE